MRSEAWRPAAAARNRSPREAGTPPSRHYDLGARSSLHGSAKQLPAVVGRRAPKESEARPPGPQTAPVERREASVPRHKRVHARLDALWDARRLASAWPAASCAGLTGVPPSTRTFLGAPPTPRFGASEATMQTPGAEIRRGNEKGCLYGELCSTRCSSYRRSSANSNVRTRVSKDEDGRLFAPMLRDASQRIWAVEAAALASRCDAPQHEGE